MNQVKENLRKKLAAFIRKTSFENLPAEVVRQAKLCILDLLGVSFAGAVQRPTAIIKRLISAAGGIEEATLWGSDRKLPVLSAVMLNAFQGHAIDMDDGHRFANGHPGVVTIPAAVALAERENRTGRELIEAVVIGYDLFIRLGRAANPELLHRGFHTTAVIGSFCSAAAASKLLGLSMPQTENALSLAGLQSAGLLEALSSGEAGKSFQVGKAVQSGTLAAFLAQQGADGPDDIFEGEKGFFRAFAGKPCDIGTVCRNLGTDFQMADVYFKRHAACRHVHSALDAVEAIVAETHLGAEQIASIDIETYSIAKNLTGHVAATGSKLAAKFSMPIAIGLYLVFGKTDSAVFQNEYIADPRVQSLAKKVTVRANPELDKNYPSQRMARVVVKTKNQLYRQEVACPKGEPETPLSDQAFMDKYRANAGVLYSLNQAERIRKTVLNIENVVIRELTGLLKAPVS